MKSQSCSSLTAIAALFAIGMPAAAALAQPAPGLYGNGGVVLVQPGAPAAPYGAYTAPSWGGSAVVPYGQSSGVVVTPGGAVPYGRYNKDAARDAFRINNAVGGQRAASDAARDVHRPLEPLNPLPGGR